MPTRTLRLYEQVDEYQRLLDWLEEHATEIELAGGELPKAIAEQMEELEGEIPEKVGRVCLVIRNLEADAAVAKDEAQRLAKLATRREADAKRLKTYLLWQLRKLGVKKIEGPLGGVRRQRNSAPSLRLADPEKIPAQWMVIPPPPPPQFDSRAALEDLREAKRFPTEPTDEPVEIDGVLIELGEHVRLI